MTRLREISVIDYIPPRKVFLKMKKTISLILCIATLLALLTLTSCGKSLEYKDGYYYCPQNGVSYQIVSFEYEPVAIGKEYATLEEGLSVIKLYEIQNADPEKWLASDDGTLFCAADENIPTMEEMEVDNILVCYESVATVSLARITDKSDIAAVIDNFANGDVLEYPLGDEQEEFLKIKMSSAKYPWLYYSLAYVEFVMDVYEYDYPESLETYEYRDVSDSVAVDVYGEFECRYAFTSKSEEDKYIDIAQKAGVKYTTLKKPNGDGTFSEYVIFIFPEIESVEGCIDAVVESYAGGSLTESALRELLSSPAKAEKVNVVRYNYGKYFIYDRVSGKCVRADGLLHTYKDRTPAEESNGDV